MGSCRRRTWPAPRSQHERVALADQRHVPERCDHVAAPAQHPHGQDGQGTGRPPPSLAQQRIHEGESVSGQVASAALQCGSAPEPSQPGSAPAPLIWSTYQQQQPTVPPPVPGPPNPTPIGSLPAQQPGLLAAHPPAQPEGGAQVNRAGTIAGSRRRFSESTARRRGVSPVSGVEWSCERRWLTTDGRAHPP